MKPPETIEVETPQIHCDGGDVDLGHPRIFLNMGEEFSVDCPYCGRHFALKQGAKAAAAH